MRPAIMERSTAQSLNASQMEDEGQRKELESASIAAERQHARSVSAYLARSLNFNPLPPNL